MTKLSISPDLSLPTNAVTSTLAVLGGKGMGKTNLAAVIVEEMAKARLRWRLLDPIGVSWGLRHSADGRGKGVECLILGGAHGDMPIEPTAGAIVADFIVEEDVDVIVDFSRKASGEMWTVGEKTRFLTELALRSFQHQGSLVDGRRREPFCLLLDEAARYIPQVIPHGNVELSKCVGAWEQLAEEGRNVGIGVGFFTQRSARINKSVLELADVLFAFGTFGPRSIEAVTEWLGDHVPKADIRVQVERIRKLEVGEALVVSPRWLKYEDVVRIRKRETFDSSATPKPGEKQRKVSGKAAAPDLAKYSERMAETVERAKAEDPRALRAEIAKLKVQLVGEHRRSATDLEQGRGEGRREAEARGDARGYARGVKDALRSVAVQARETRTELRNALDHAMETLDVDAIVAAVETRLAGRSIDIPHSDKNGIEVPLQSSPPAKASAPPRLRTAEEGALPRAQLRLLVAASRLEAVKVATPNRSHVAALAGVSPASSSTETGFAANVRAGLLEAVGQGAVRLTAEGRRYVPSVGAPPTLEEYHNQWRRLLSGAPLKLLNAMLDTAGRNTAELNVTRSALADVAGVSMTSSATETAFAKLIAFDLFAVSGPGRVRPGAIMFPEGLY